MKLPKQKNPRADTNYSRIEIEHWLKFDLSQNDLVMLVAYIKSRHCRKRWVLQKHSLTPCDIIQKALLLLLSKKRNCPKKRNRIECVKSIIDSIMWNLAKQTKNLPNLVDGESVIPIKSTNNNSCEEHYWNQDASKGIQEMLNAAKEKFPNNQDIISLLYLITVDGINPTKNKELAEAIGTTTKRVTKLKSKALIFLTWWRKQSSLLISKTS